MRYRRSKDEIKQSILADAHTFTEKKHREKRKNASIYWRMTHEEEIAYRKLCKNMDRLS